nr:hypothetical protein [Tanacetum cinerariifolium]
MISHKTNIHSTSWSLRWRKKSPSVSSKKLLFAEKTVTDLPIFFTSEHGDLVSAYNLLDEMCDSLILKLET